MEQGIKLRDIAEACGVTMLSRKVRPQVSNFITAPEIEDLFRDQPNTFHNFLPKTTQGQRRWLAGAKSVQGAKALRWYAAHAPLGLKMSDAHQRIIQVRDWLRMRGDEHLPDCGFEEAERRAAAWHREEWQRAEAQWQARDAEYRARRAAQHPDDAPPPAPAIDLTKPFPEPWLPPETVNGLSIVHLGDQFALDSEGQAMHHCVASYAGLIHSGHCCIYSVREPDGKRLATLELNRTATGYRVNQLRAVCNGKPSPEAEKAVRDWLHKHQKWTDKVVDLLTGPVAPMPLAIMGIPAPNIIAQPPPLALLGVGP